MKFNLLNLNIDKDLLSKIEWENPKVLVFIFAFTLITLFKFNIVLITTTSLIIIAILFLIEFLIWKFLTNIPTINRNNIGVILAIVTENEEIQNRLKNDLIFNLRDILSKKCHKDFQLEILSKYHSKKIFESYKNNDKEKLLNYHIKTRSQYLVFGYCDKRMHKGKKHYFIKLDASVCHREIKKEIKQAFSGDMRKVLPNILFPETEEIAGFQITSNIIGLGARYVIGKASFYSKDFQMAFELHKNLLEEINNYKSKLGKKNIDIIDLPIINNIEELTKKSLKTTALILARINYLYIKNYEEMNRFIEEVQALEPNNYESLLLKSIYFFLKSRDINSAMEELKKAENSSRSDSTWLYNKAFLLAYKDKLDDAYHTYTRAFSGRVGPDIPLVVEEFTYNIWKEEKEKIQLLYCLGLINFFKKKDYILAKQYFKEFVELAEKKNVFLEQIKYSKNYLAKMS